MIAGSSRSFSNTCWKPKAIPVSTAPVALRFRHDSTLPAGRAGRSAGGRSSSVLALASGQSSRSAVVRSSASPSTGSASASSAGFRRVTISRDGSTLAPVGLETHDRSGRDGRQTADRSIATPMSSPRSRS